MNRSAHAAMPTSMFLRADENERGPHTSDRAPPRGETCRRRRHPIRKHRRRNVARTHARPTGPRTSRGVLQVTVTNSEGYPVLIYPPPATAVSGTARGTAVGSCTSPEHLRHNRRSSPLRRRVALRTGGQRRTRGGRQPRRPQAIRQPIPRAKSEPPVGLEPTTYALQGRCATNCAKAARPSRAARPPPSGAVHIPPLQCLTSTT